MAEPKTSEIDRLFAKHSKDDLWEHISEWWAGATRVRTVMVLALHHREGLSFPAIVQKAGAAEATVLEVLDQLEKQGIVQGQGENPRVYRIANEQEFLKLMQECCHKTSLAAGVLGTLAGWAMGTAESNKS